MHSLYFLCLYKAASFYRRVNWKPKTEIRQIHDFSTRYNVCNKHYTLSHFRVAVGNGLQLWSVLHFKRSGTLENPIPNFVTKLFIRFLPYTGIHHENPLYEAVLHTHEKRNVCYTILHTFRTDGRLSRSLCLKVLSRTHNDTSGGVSHAAALTLTAYYWQHVNKNFKEWWILRSSGLQQVWATYNSIICHVIKLHVHLASLFSTSKKAVNCEPSFKNNLH
jgi:hypothetical protein